MSDTALDICSRALLLIGANPITSFADGDTPSVVANKIYESTLRAQLTRRWGFTRTTVLLTASATPPIGGAWASSFDLTSDLLVIHRIEINGLPIRYERFEHTIHCNAATTDAVFMTYSRRVLESEFPPYFTDALELELASRFAFPLTGQQDLAAVLRRQALDAWRLARVAGAQEQSARRLPISRFLAFRRGLPIEGTGGGGGGGVTVSAEQELN